MLGTYSLSEGSKQEFYQKALAARQKIKCDLSRVLSECDVILSPVSADSAPLIENIPATPLDVYRQDRFTVVANLSGLPAISIPQSGAAVQLMGNAFSEELLYAMSDVLMKEVTV